MTSLTSGGRPRLGALAQATPMRGEVAAQSTLALAQRGSASPIERHP